MDWQVRYGAWIALFVRKLHGGRICIDGFIFREGTLKVGDRILMINAVNGSQKSLSDAFLLLARPQTNVHLLVEYDVSVMGEHASCLYVFKSTHPQR